MKINYFDGICTIKSENQLDNIIKTMKTNKKATELYDEDGNLLYSVAVAKSGNGSINANGIIYAAAPADDGKGKVVIEIPQVENVRAYIADEYAAFIGYVEAIDVQIKQAAESAAQVNARVREMINIVC
jgi:hypothetical protein